MPNELIGVTSGLRWLRTSIRRVGGWLQTELYFDVNGDSLSLAFDGLPDRAFLIGVATIHTLHVHEANSDEPAFSGACRYRVRIASADPLGEHEAYGTYVRYGPVNAV